MCNNNRISRARAIHRAAGDPVAVMEFMPVFLPASTTRRGVPP